MASQIIESIVEKATEIIEKSQELKEEIDEIREWNSFSKIVANISKIVVFFESVTIAVENIYEEIKEQFDDSTSSDDKLEAAAIVIDEIIKLPIYLELIDKYIIKMIISVVVHYLNERYGHEWLLTVK